MRVLPLGIDNLSLFINYCKKHRSEVDASYIYDDELEEFKPDDDNPTYLLINDDRIVGAVSLMLASRFKKSGRARFRILHSTIEVYEAYKMLIDSVNAKIQGMKEIFIFLPEEKTIIGKILLDLGFYIQRYAWVMKKSDEYTENPIFPEGYNLKPFISGKDEGNWCNISNLAFSAFNWYSEITPDAVRYYDGSNSFIKDGMAILWHGEKPVGIINVEREPDENIAEIGPIAVLPEYQGKGLGRNLLRAGIEIGSRAGFKTTVLSVNGDNQRAAELYISEGFKKDTLSICYSKEINMPNNENGGISHETKGSIYMCS